MLIPIESGSVRINNSTMKFPKAACLIATAVLTLAASSQPAQKLTANSSIEQILIALDTVGQNLHDFTAHVTLTEEDAAAGDSTSRTGIVYYQKQSDGNARIHIIFDTRTAGGATDHQKIEYLLANGALTDRDYVRKTEIVRQVLKPGEKIDLLKLGQGPFPLPIGQSPAQVHAEFDVTKPAAAKSDPPDTVHLRLIPKPDTQFADKFSAIDVYVDLKTNFPKRIDTIDSNQTIIRTTDLDLIGRNTGLNDKQFDLPSIGSDWNRRTEPYQQ